jgi:NAD(P)-dependent dehydrogenase (short-subunit alcohol dehydrogenase family)
MGEQSLSGKVALVSGAGSPIGMGRVIALAYVAAGAKVAMMDIDGPALERTANEAREIGGDNAVSTIVADISDWSDAVRAVQHTIATLGGLQILVNLAGLHPRALLPVSEQRMHFWDLPVEVWERIISVNSTGPFLMARAAVGHMVDQGWGRVIGVTTSLDTMIRDIPYGPSKATHEALAAAMAKDLEGTGVTSNALLPGGGANTMFVSREEGRDFSKLVQPEVMGPPAVWMASDASDGINGMRIIAADWDDALPPADNLKRSAAPAAWPQLGRQT